MDEDNDKIGVLWLNPPQYRGFSTPLFFPESVLYLSLRAFYDFPITASTALARATGHPGGRMNQDDYTIRVYRRDRQDPRSGR